MPSGLTPEDEPLDDGLRELAGMLLTETSLDRMLEVILTLAVAGIAGCDAASVTLVQNGRVATPVSSSDHAVDVDRAQYDRRRGPCLHSIEAGEVVRVDAFATDGRWPELRAAAERCGIASALSVPLTVGREALGALNLYSAKEEAFVDAEDRAVLFGRQASVALANAHALRRAELLARQLTQALENRDIIGQAKGIIMAGQDLTADEAFDVLRRASQRSNRKLHEVAREIVDRRNGAGRPRT